MNDRTKAEREAFELFGEMRQLTDEEQKERREALKRISEPTGRNFFDMLEMQTEKYGVITTKRGE